MGKINIRALPRPKPHVETRTFTDPQQPGMEMELTLRKPDMARMLLISEQGSELSKIWVESGVEYPSVDGPISMSNSLCQTVAFLKDAQSDAAGNPLPDAEVYNEDDWFQLSVRAPTAFMHVLEWAAELQQAVESPPGNSPGPGDGSSSVPLPNTTT